ncbi:Deoxyribodipyrimidine photo-lyase [Buchnera aphidicola (Eriosoma lanigerum)]|uniref:deoxyribodipyrimidine photo-lyase n=1 Tax=Buchnera aphidicola TaxID=9 RepID=UPI00346444AD
MKYHNLVWFRNDLRVQDNSALHFACKNKTDIVSALFIATPKQWLQHNDSPKKIFFIYQHLILLKKKLNHLGINLYYHQTDYFKDVIEYILQFSLKNKVNQIFYNYQYEINEKKRDQLIEKSLLQNNIHTYGFHDSVIFHPKSIKNKFEITYKNFSPFRKKIIIKLKKNIPVCYPSPIIRSNSIIQLQPGIEYFNFPFEKIDLSSFPIGEEIALLRLQNFCKYSVENYVNTRNGLFYNTTSCLSSYLNIGVLSARQCINYLIYNYPNILYSNYENNWLTQLIWREFYKHLLEGYSLLSKNQSNCNWERNIIWNHDKHHLFAWKNGITGYPIIDAGMRQLNQFGWISNRMRMITASFLVKHLLIDWRKGEKYFMSKLIDGSLAENNGGWQWIASVGTDSIPYFRIFNPILQSQKFDPNCEYIKTMIPELDNTSNNYIHNPIFRIKQNCNKSNYPKPIINHCTARKNTLLIFSNARNKK